MRQRLPERSIEAVLFPARYRAFVGLTAPGELSAAWGDDRRRPWVLANMAHAAYHDSTTIRSWLATTEVELRFYDTRGSQAFLAVWPDRAVLAFRGTELLERAATGWFGNDLLADFHLTLAECAGVEVHRGFLRELDKLWTDGILPELRALTGTRDIPVWITGHSMGGAMATLAALRVPCEAVVTFGEPRVGRQLDRALRSKRHVRYVNGRDPVTKLPPTWWPFLYEDHGAVVRLRDPRGSNMVYDHAIPYYTQLLAPDEAGCVVERLVRVPDRSRRPQ